MPDAGFLQKLSSIQKVFKKILNIGAWGSVVKPEPQEIL